MRMGIVRRTAETGLMLALLAGSSWPMQATAADRDDEHGAGAVLTEHASADQPASGTTTESNPADAGDPEAIAEAQREMLRPKFSIDADFDTTIDAPLDGGGDLSIYRSNARLGVLLPQEDRSAFSFTLRTTRTFYNWSEPEELGLPNDEQPFQRINEMALSTQYFRPIDERWTWFAGGRLNFSAEDGANLAHGLTVGGVGGVEYRFDNGLRLSGGVVASTRLEEDILPIPFVAINWDIDEHWSISSNNNLELQLRYKPNEQWRFAVGASYARDEFRLDESGFAPEGAAKRIRVPVRFETTWTPHARVTLSGEVGADFLHRVQVSDSNGIRRREFAADPALALGAMLTFRF